MFLYESRGLRRGRGIKKVSWICKLVREEMNEECNPGRAEIAVQRNKQYIGLPPGKFTAKTYTKNEGGDNFSGRKKIRDIRQITVKMKASRNPAIPSVL